MKLFKFVTFCFAALMVAALVAGFVPPANSTPPSAAIRGKIRGNYAMNVPQPTAEAPLTASYEISSPSISSVTGLRSITTGRFNCPDRTTNSRFSPNTSVDETYLSPPDAIPDRAAGPDSNLNNPYYEGFGSSNRARAKI